MVKRILGQTYISLCPTETRFNAKDISSKDTRSDMSLNALSYLKGRITREHCLYSFGRDRRAEKEMHTLN
jgi:hypothetical protein